MDYMLVWYRSSNVSTWLWSVSLNYILFILGSRREGKRGRNREGERENTSTWQPQQMCEGQIITYRGQFSPPIIGLGFKLRLSGLTESTFTPWAVPAVPVVCFYPESWQIQFITLMKTYAEPNSWCDGIWNKGSWACTCKRDKVMQVMLSWMGFVSSWNEMDVREAASFLTSCFVALGLQGEDSHLKRRTSPHQMYVRLLPCYWMFQLPEWCEVNTSFIMSQSVPYLLQ